MNKIGYALMILLLLISLEGCKKNHEEPLITEPTDINTEIVEDIERVTEPRATLPQLEVSLPEGVEDAPLETMATAQSNQQTLEENTPIANQGMDKNADTVSDKSSTETTNPNEVTIEETSPEKLAESCGCDYAKYLALSAEAQEAYMDSFASPKDFINWCRNAEAEHATHDNRTVVEGGILDIGDYIN